MGLRILPAKAGSHTWDVAAAYSDTFGPPVPTATGCVHAM
jgi:hypothetical protein